MTNPDLNARITQVVQGAPAWLRSELASQDPATRQRAEEALAAMIVSALSGDEMGRAAG